jgi:signal transduction histidine kinase
MSITLEDVRSSLSGTSRRILREPFTRQACSELLYLVLGSALAFVGVAFVLLTMVVGIALAITFFGLAILALSVRSARGLGHLNREMARSLIGERIEAPDPFQSRKGFLGWLQAALRDRTGWRSVAYLVTKAPLAVVGIYAALSLWLDAFICFKGFVQGQQPRLPFGIVHVFIHIGFSSDGSWGTASRISTLLLGFVLLLVAPWAVRLAVFVDRLLMRALLSPDATTARLRSLEHARTVTVDDSVATLRRIERDLHDGTQAQLVALAMRLGLAKEELALPKKKLDLDQVRALVEMAHTETKEIIVELRDLTRGIHPPALDVGESPRVP